MLQLLLVTMVLLYGMAQNCLFKSSTDQTKCLECKRGYFHEQLMPYDGTVLVTECEAATSVQESGTIYVSSTCTSACVGTNTHPFPNLLAAIASIPFPSLSLTTNPTWVVLIMDQESYIVNSHITTGSLTYYNRRKLINLIIKPDPQTQFEGMPTLYIKTQLFSIFTAVSLIVQGLTISGIGLNELPMSFREQNKIFCNKNLADQLFNETGGVQNSNIDESMVCGLRDYILLESSQPESYGFFTVEPLFEVVPAIVPLIVIKSCIIKDFYAIGTPRFGSLIKSVLRLPVTLQITDTTIDNVFFEQGIISSMKPSNWLGDNLQLSDNSLLLELLENYKMTQLFQVIVQGLTVTNYAHLHLTNFNDFAYFSGALISMANHPVDINVTNVLVKDCNVTNPVYYELGPDFDGPCLLGDGISFAHYSIISYTSIEVQTDVNGVPKMSHLNINQLKYSNVSFNYGIQFHPTTTDEYFFSPSKVHNWLQINNFRAEFSLLRFVICWSNADYYVNYQSIEHVVSNYVNGAFQFYKINYLNTISVQNVVCLDMIEMWSDDDNINELNAFLIYNNDSSYTKSHPITVTMQNMQLTMIKNLVWFEGYGMYLDYFYLKNVVITQQYQQLIWSSFGAYFKNLVDISYVTMINTTLWQLFYLKQVPIQAKLFHNNNINSRAFYYLIFRESQKYVEDWQIVLSNYSYNFVDDFCETSQWMLDIVSSNAKKVSLNNLKALGTVVIENSRFTVCQTQARQSEIIYANAGFHKIIRNSIINTVGMFTLFVQDGQFILPVIQRFVMINTTIIRHMLILGPTEPFWNDEQKQYVIKSDNFITIRDHKITITDCIFQDTGIRFSKLLFQNPYETYIKNVTFFNFGIYVQNPREITSIDNVFMSHSNRNQTSTFFLLFENSALPKWTNNIQMKTGSRDSQVMLTNMVLQGNLTKGHIQLTNIKVYAENMTITSFDLLLDQLIQQKLPIPSNIQLSSSPVVLKSFGWIVLKNVSLQNCSSNILTKQSCIQAFQTSIVEAYQSQFINSSSSFGGFIYSFGVQLYLEQCTFMNGQANKGGSIYMISSNLTIINSKFLDSYTLYNGGHLYSERSYLTIVNSNFRYGQSEDSGGSLYLYNQASVSITNTTFSNVIVNVQSVIFMRSQKQRTIVTWKNITFEDCLSKKFSAAVYIEQATLDLFNISFNRITQVLSTQVNTGLQTIITLQSVIFTINQMNFSQITCQQIAYIDSCTGQLNDILVQSSYFDQKGFQFRSSDLSLLRFNISYMDDGDLVEMLLGMNEFYLELDYRKNLFFIVNSQVSMTDCIVPSLSLVSELQKLEITSVILELVTGINSESSNLRLQNILFAERYLITTSQFVNTKKRILYKDPVEKLLRTQLAKSLQMVGGSVYLFNCRFPNFAVASPIISLENCEFNFTQVRNQQLNLLTKSLIDSFCVGSYEIFCKFLDFRVNLNKEMSQEGVYLIFNTTLNSYGTTFSFVCEKGAPATKLQNIQLQARDSATQASAFETNQAELDIHNISITSYPQPIIIQNLSKISFKNGKITDSQNGGISLKDSQLDLETILFENNKAQSGGAINATCQRDNGMTISVQGCTFKKNSATDSGGAIRNVDCKLLTENSTFTDNLAAYGDDFLGYPNSVILHQVVQITDQTITNLAAIAQSVAQDILKAHVPLNQTLYVVGGQNISCILNVIDNFGQIYPLGSYFTGYSLKQVINSQESPVKIQITSADPNIKFSLVSYSFELISNAIVIQELYIFAPQNYVGASVILKFYQYYLQGNNQVQVLVSGISLGFFYLVILPCPQGTISTADRCFLCPTKTYSLNPLNEKCDNCQQFQICNGRNYLFATPGYYLAPNSSTPISCPVMDACNQIVIDNSVKDRIFWIRHYKQMLGTDVYNTNLKQYIAKTDVEYDLSTQDTYCSPGYQGQFCVMCKTGYGQTSDGICSNCFTSATIYIRFILSTVIILALTYSDSIEPLQVDKGESGIGGVLFKQLTDFTQFVNIIVGMISNVTPSFLPILSILTDQISVFPSDFDSGFDCFFLQNISDPFTHFKYKILIGVLIPWLYIVVMVIVILLIDKIKQYLKYQTIHRSISVFDIISVTVISNMYSFYFYLSQLCLNTFSCMTVLDPSSEAGEVEVLAVMTDIQCWEKDHLILIFTFGIPTLIFYVFGIPLLFIIYISKYYKGDAELPYKGEKINRSVLKQIGGEHESFIVQNQKEDSSAVPVESQIVNSNIKPVKMSIYSKQGNPEQHFQNQEIQSPIADELGEKKEDVVEINYSGFLTENLKQEFKYWDIYVQFKKLLIISIMIITNSLDVQTASIVVLIVFISFLLISYKYQPYTSQVLNNFEGASDLLMTIIIHLALLIIQSENAGVQVFSVLLIIVLKFVYYYYALKTIINEYIEDLKKPEVEKKEVNNTWKPLTK